MKAEELADAICRIDTLTEYQRELIAKAAAELRRLDALEQAAEPVAANVVSGALFDFSGFLTTRPDAIEVGATAEASPMVELIQEFAKMRGLSIDNPNVLDWQATLYTQPARKPMTREDMRKLLAEHFDNGDLTGDDFRLIRAVERFHDIKE
jgi:hypothetical protein